MNEKKGGPKPRPIARQVRLDELQLIEPPAATRTYLPIKHAQAYEMIREALTASRFTIQSTELLLTPRNRRMFATLDLTNEIAPGVTLSVGIRNANDKTFGLGLLFGNRVCDTLAARVEIFHVRHNRPGKARLASEIANAVQILTDFQQHETSRVRALQEKQLTDENAEALMLRAFEHHYVTTWMLPAVIAEWRNPSFDTFSARTAWSLLNAFTCALRSNAKKSPEEHRPVTMRLGEFFDSHFGIKPFPISQTKGETDLPVTKL